MLARISLRFLWIVKYFHIVDGFSNHNGEQLLKHRVSCMDWSLWLVRKEKYRHVSITPPRFCYNACDKGIDDFVFFFKLRGSGSNRQVTDFNVKVGHKFLHFTHEISSWTES